MQPTVRNGILSVGRSGAQSIEKLMYARCEHLTRKHAQNKGSELVEVIKVGMVDLTLLRWLPNSIPLHGCCRPYERCITLHNCGGRE
jgi:hypothetical protein